MRTLAVELAVAGFASLRFDYRGQGDSPGAFAGDRLATDWLEDVGAAADVLREVGLGQITAVGRRLGATLAARWWADGGHTGDGRLVLWDPCASGRAFLREQQALQIQDEVSEDGAIDARGYLVTAAAVRSIASLQLPALPSTGPDSLALLRPDHPGTARVRKALAGSGVETADAVDQTSLLGVPPPLRQVPHHSIRIIVDWLDARIEHKRVSVNWPPWPVADVADDVREEVLALGQIGLTGILTTPTRLSTQTLVVMANTSDEHHIGPGRMWVDLARRWAQLGVQSLRFDLSGVGDSPAHPGAPEDIIYSPLWLDDYRSAVDQVAPGRSSQVILVGHCSGAYSALEASLTLRPRAVCAVNPILTSRTMSPGTSLYDGRRRVTRPWPRWVVAFSRWHFRPADWLWRGCVQVVPWRAPMAGLAEVARSGTDLLAVCVTDDSGPLRESLYWRWWGERMLGRRWSFRLEALPWADHPTYLHRTRAAVQDLLDEAVRDHASAMTAALGHAGQLSSHR
jgi:alpha-beta hydrolase superfamily lysophospholipase